MIISRVILKNWRNFQKSDVELGARVFLVGPNASGKSNFLDAFRFLHDIAKPRGGGLQKSIEDRGGLPKIRCLAAQRDPKVGIEVHFSDLPDKQENFIYSIEFSQEERGKRRPILSKETAIVNGRDVFKRPNAEDQKDPERLTQTYLEQINENKGVRGIADFLGNVSYLHLVPQLLKHPSAFTGPGIPEDPFGRSFMEKLVKTPETTRRARLVKIEQALKLAVPQLTRLEHSQDAQGLPHLEAIYEHWRPQGAKHRETEFSDGTLRLIGILWALMESDSLLLLEEPELSLNSGIVREIPQLIYRLQRYKNKRPRQVMISTHSHDLLANRGLSLKEVLILRPTKNGTEIEPASSFKDIPALLESGMSLADAVIPKTVPENVGQLVFPFYGDSKNGKDSH